MKEENPPKCKDCGKPTIEVGSWEVEEDIEDYNAEYIYLYQCPECKTIKLT